MTGRGSLCLSALSLVLLVAGCGDDPAQGGDWPASTDPVDGTGIVYYADGAVHLDHGSSIELGAEPAGFVVAGDGVYFVAQEEGPQDGGAQDGGAQDDKDSAPELLLATKDGVESTGAEADPGSLTASPDGRYLAFIDATTGAKDTYGTSVATAVVVDLVEGEELVRSTAGMGDPDGDDDLADLYEDASGPEILAVTEDEVYVATPDDYWVYDLEDGEGEVLPEPAVVTGAPWAEDEDDGLNPSGTWRIRDPLDGPPQFEPVAGGRPVVTTSDYGTWGVGSWLDDESVLTSGVGDPDAFDPRADDTRVLLICRLPSGRCDPVPGTEGGVILPANGLRLERSATGR